MKTLGITAEYNPFHNGHAYHIREAKARTGCDSVIALMSGDFVQRGTPALVSKYVRAEAALRLGADIVIELPVYSATASAERFAEGAVRAFTDLSVDAISYGVECDDNLDETAASIQKAGSFFAEESDGYRAVLKEKLAAGMSFPAARQEAYTAVCGDSPAFLSTPNNILAIEYEKAKIRLGAGFESVPVARVGSGYHDTDANEYASATAIRKMVEEKSESINVTFPAELKEIYADAFRYPVFPDDLSSALFSALHGRTWEELAQYSDISEDTAKRLADAAKHPFTWTSLTEALHERSHTQSHVNRALCHILLGEDLNLFFELNFTLEKISATTKSLLSTKQFHLESIVFYLTHESEQFPFYVKANDSHFLALEIPKFMFDNPRLKPPLLERLRFITKAQNGMTYHFTSRAMRYQTNPDGKIHIIIKHSEDLVNQAHRNSKREFLDTECLFSPAHLVHTVENEKKKKHTQEEDFVVRPKEYDGRLTNISSGGCCIKTTLPIKEKQYLSLRVPSLELHEHMIGIIRRTRKLLDNTYNLHIQFLKISLESKNKINAYAFKYEI